MKKLFSLLLVLTLALGLSACTTTTGAPAEALTLNITITNTDEGTELFSGKVSVESAETLADFLAAQDAFAVEMEDGDYGKLITSMAGAEQNMSDGPWWTYSSDNNEQCVAAGYCDASSSLKIADGDNFVFELKSSFE